MRSAPPPSFVPERASAQPDGTLGAAALWRAERAAGHRSEAQRDALARAAVLDEIAGEYTRSARACDARAEHAATMSDRVRFAECAAVDYRAAAAYRRRAAAALLADDGHDVKVIRAHDAPLRGRAA